MDPIIDWQISRHDIKSRGQYLLETGKWADCHFLVGQEPNHQMLAGHKLILAMASPVFEAMFFGGLAEKNDPIPILDLDPSAFKSLLEYIYTDKISINSVDKACELCYGAKKYMLPHVVEQCITFLWSDLCPKNVCRAYEFAKLFEEPRLMEKCLQIMCTKSIDVIQDSSFEDVELSTIITILDQDVLNIDSELNLFWAINKYAEKHGLCSSRSHESNQTGNDQDTIAAPQSPPSVDVEAGSSNDQSNNQNIIGNNEQAGPAVAIVNAGRQQELPTIRDAIRRIRFLSLNPQQFADGPARTNLLTQSEAFAILMNISTSNSCYPMPEGFTTNKNPRNAFTDSSPSSPIPGPSGNPLPMTLRPGTSNGGLFPQHVPPPQPAPLPTKAVPAPALAPVPPVHPDDPDSPYYLEEMRNNDSNYDRKYYCRRIMRQQTECLNTSVLDCSLTFIVDRSVCITGIEVPTQVQGSTIVGNDRYSELLYAHLLDAHGSRLTYTHCNQRVQYNSMLEISFDRPVFIQRHKMYKIGVVFNKVGWYPVSQSVAKVNCDNVGFTFCVGSQSESVRDGLIRTIVFTYTRDGISYT
ncbi:uncharacterized protein LOC131675853 [Topomyia yanbarensis]|uniref:uncharacterized protein LOC131675853 n=1 Tax=Topomyia yanbarensis TaxID=2498891 RepID=UPI00273B9ED9|nr:uncharacterized protein LOC131675853 [Topomyia yanbarensis]XP_058810979.1 uncharacterized protein LOC131675853 [Topomyia yanbarensis]